MTTIINHDIRSVDGKYIVMPPYKGSQEGWGNLSFPVINADDVSAQYPVATKFVDDDRVFRYCYAGSNIIYPQRGIANANPHLEGTCLGNAVAGAYTLDLPPACADFTGTVIYNTKDIYAGGWLWIMGTTGAPTLHEFHKLLSNEALDTATSTYVRVTLGTPIHHAAATPWITSYKNIYSNCQMSYPDTPTLKQAIVCMTAGGLTVTSTRYFWGQTWGPIWATAVGDPPGTNDNERELMFWQGGVIAHRHTLDPTSYSRQRAGYVLTDCENTGDMMFMLQLEQ